MNAGSSRVGYSSSVRGAAQQIKVVSTIGRYRRDAIPIQFTIRAIVKNASNIPMR